MAISFHCPQCRSCWPNSRQFAVCPDCRVKCRSVAVSKVMTPGEARTRMREIEFVRYCAEREEKRLAEGRPSPEEIGQMEAAEIRRQLAEIRELPVA